MIVVNLLQHAHFPNNLDTVFFLKMFNKSYAHHVIKKSVSNRLICTRSLNRSIINIERAYGDMVHKHHSLLSTAFVSRTATSTKPKFPVPHSASRIAPPFIPTCEKRGAATLDNQPHYSEIGKLLLKGFAGFLLAAKEKLH
jgi:hypothetical protein